MCQFEFYSKAIILSCTDELLEARRPVRWIKMKWSGEGVAQNPMPGLDLTAPLSSPLPPVGSAMNQYQQGQVHNTEKERDIW